MNGIVKNLVRLICGGRMHPPRGWQRYPFVFQHLFMEDRGPNAAHDLVVDTRAPSDGVAVVIIISGVPVELWNISPDSDFAPNEEALGMLVSVVYTYLRVHELYVDTEVRDDVEVAVMLSTETGPLLKRAASFNDVRQWKKTTWATERLLSVTVSFNQLWRSMVLHAKDGGESASLRQPAGSMAAENPAAAAPPQAVEAGSSAARRDAPAEQRLGGSAGASAKAPTPVGCRPSASHSLPPASLPVNISAADRDRRTASPPPEHLTYAPMSWPSGRLASTRLGTCHSPLKLFEHRRYPSVSQRGQSPTEPLPFVAGSAGSNRSMPTPPFAPSGAVADSLSSTTNADTSPHTWFRSPNSEAPPDFFLPPPMSGAGAGARGGAANGSVGALPTQWNAAGGSRPQRQLTNPLFLSGTTQLHRFYFPRLLDMAPPKVRTTARQAAGPKYSSMFAAEILLDESSSSSTSFNSSASEDEESHVSKDYGEVMSVCDLTRGSRRVRSRQSHRDPSHTTARLSDEGELEGTTGSEDEHDDELHQLIDMCESATLTIERDVVSAFDALQQTFAIGRQFRERAGSRTWAVNVRKSAPDVRDGPQ